MKTSQTKKLLICTLLILSIVPVLMSTMPANASVRNGNGGGNNPKGGGNKDPHTQNNYIYPYSPNNSTTTNSTATSWAST